jgi:LPS O-antigen subunit length determinant protein (WzzB/FepE family)
LKPHGELDNSLRSYTDVHNGENVAKLFVKQLQELVIELYNKYEAKKQDMVFTKEDELSYNDATHCHICELSLKKGAALATASNDEITVRDHCHITGKYRGAIM